MLERLIRAGLTVARSTSRTARSPTTRSASSASGQPSGRRVPRGHHGRPARTEDANRHDRSRADRAPAGDAFTLTAEDTPGTATRVSVSFARLPARREARRPSVPERRPRTPEGREYRRRRRALPRRRGRGTALAEGLNLPGIDLGMSAFTDHDRACLAFALDHGVDAVSQSSSRERPTSEPCVTPRPISAGARSSSRKSSAPAHWTTTTRSSRRRRRDGGAR